MKLIFFADKHQSVLEVDIDGCGQACPIYRDNFALSSRYLKEKEEYLDFYYVNRPPSHGD